MRYRFRAGAVGAVGAALAVAAHGFGGGGLPGSAGITLLIGVAAAIGVGTAQLPGRTGAYAALIGAQAGGHLVLGWASGHQHPLQLSTTMLVPHLAAALLCGLLIVAAERLYAALARVADTLASIPQPAAVDAPPPILDSRSFALSHWLLGAGTVRGPPVRS